MLGVTALRWWLGVGGACQFFGVVLLIVGLSKTRRAFDISRAGLVAASVGVVRDATRAAAQWVRAGWARVTGHPRRQDARVTPAPVVAKTTVSGAIAVTRHLDTTDPAAAIREVHDLVFRVRDGLLDEVTGAKQQAARLVQDEAAARAREDEGLREDLSNLAVGGLATEVWASVLILTGVGITTVAAVLVG